MPAISESGGGSNVMKTSANQFESGGGSNVMKTLANQFKVSRHANCPLVHTCISYLSTYMIYMYYIRILFFTTFYCRAVLCISMAYAITRCPSV